MFFKTKKIISFILVLSIFYTTNAQVFPDNVNQSDCFTATNLNTTPSQFWNPQVIQETDPLYKTVFLPLVGDIDADGIVEIFIGSFTDYTTTVCILNGNDLSPVSTIHFNNKVFNANDNGMAALVRYPDGDTTQGAIILSLEEGTQWTASEIRRLVSYDKNGTLLHTSNVTTQNRAIISVTDFNNDGFPEVFCGNTIFDASTLSLLCTGTATQNSGKSIFYDLPDSRSFAANVLGDEKLELICGNCIYNVNIASRTDAALNSISINKTITPPPGFPTDGHTTVADFNHDGQLDVLVVSKTGSAFSGGSMQLFFYAYNPLNSEILFQQTIDNIWWYSSPTIGDIDGDDNLEITIVYGGDYSGSNNYINSYKYTSANGLSQVWHIPQLDATGCAGLSLFDFNQDDIMEILYRDEEFFYILNGSGQSHLTGNDTTSCYPLFTLPITSGTGSEFPLVADVNHDNTADILVTGRYNNPPQNYREKVILISAPNLWAPARPVWNQYHYHVVNINKDLTVPPFYFNQGTFFTNPDNPDQIRQPFNNFLQQATLLDIYGIPHQNIYPLADAVFLQNLSTSSNNCSTFMLDFSFENQGDSALVAPFSIMIYKDSVGGEIIDNLIINETLGINESNSLHLAYSAEDLAPFSPLQSFVISINDEGNGIAQNGSLQEECDIYNNSMSLPFIDFTAVGTTVLYDTICEGTPYSKSGFIINSSQTAKSGIYSFENSITTPQGCDSIVTLMLTVISCGNDLYLPNTITPSNHDRLNDFFSLPKILLPDIDKFEIHIYDRWGKLVFYSIDKSFEWNGDNNGKIYANAIYSYVIKIKNAHSPWKLYKGVITVL